jgi:tRNA(Arg) A34 adenosine deaminase TadA
LGFGQKTVFIHEEQLLRLKIDYIMFHISLKVMKQTTVYVNLEPCIMCASALYQLKIKKLIFGAKNPRFGGIISLAGNKEYGHDHEIEVIFLNIFFKKKISL